MSFVVPDISLLWMTPWTPSCNTASWLQTMPFRVGLHVSDRQQNQPQDFRVELWTNVFHKENSEGEWHAVPMKYQQAQQVIDNNSVTFMFGVDLVLTGLGIYSFTFRAKHKFQAVYTWADIPENDGHLIITIPVKEHTVWVQEPMSAQITHNIYIGNFTAAMNSPYEGFDSLLNMSDDVHVFPQQFTRPIMFKRYPVPFGVDNIISCCVVKEAVAWLRIMSDQCQKVMVCSRTGHARSGSILIAFIFFMNTNLNFEDAYAFVNKRSMVFPHKGLKNILYGLYPRS